ncbi:DoxX family membrane protein [Nonomuraea roseola]|uniref:DoxX family membrane protein n=1 Tax=Nonomuraea roseola TaxID=46179 RepID=A0ABV5Q4Y5_9ACTN
MLKRITSDLALLAARIVVGVIFMAHGLQKWQGGLENTTAMFSQLGVPSPQLAAVFATAVEIIGGAMLIIGLGVRLAAVLLFADMVGAGYFVESRSGVFNSTPRWELVVALAAACLLLMALGGGRLGVDGLLHRSRLRRRDRRETEAAATAAAAATAEPRGSVIVSHASDEPGAAPAHPAPPHPATTQPGATTTQPTTTQPTTAQPGAEKTLTDTTAEHHGPARDTWDAEREDTDFHTGDRGAGRSTSGAYSGSGTEPSDNDSDTERSPFAPGADPSNADADTERPPLASRPGPGSDPDEKPAERAGEKPGEKGPGSGHSPSVMGVAGMAGMAAGVMSMSALSSDANPGSGDANREPGDANSGPGDANSAPGDANTRAGDANTRREPDDRFHDAGDPAHDTIGEIPHTEDDTARSTLSKESASGEKDPAHDTSSPIYDSLMGSPPRMAPDEGRPSWLDEPGGPDPAIGSDAYAANDSENETGNATSGRLEGEGQDSPEDLLSADMEGDEPGMAENERISEPQPLDALPNNGPEDVAPEGAPEPSLGGHSVPAQGGAPEPADDDEQARRSELEELRAEVDRLKSELAAVRRRLGVGG